MKRTFTKQILLIIGFFAIHSSALGQLVDIDFIKYKNAINPEADIKQKQIEIICKYAQYQSDEEYTTYLYMIDGEKVLWSASESSLCLCNPLMENRGNIRRIGFLGEETFTPWKRRVVYKIERGENLFADPTLVMYSNNNLLDSAIVNKIYTKKRTFEPYVPEPMHLAYAKSNCSSGR